jgi:hypothetical protein
MRAPVATGHDACLLYPLIIKWGILLALEHGLMPLACRSRVGYQPDTSSSEAPSTDDARLRLPQTMITGGLGGSPCLRKHPTGTASETYIGLAVPYQALVRLWVQALCLRRRNAPRPMRPLPKSTRLAGSGAGFVFPPDELTSPKVATAPVSTPLLISAEK